MPSDAQAMARDLTPNSYVCEAHGAISPGEVLMINQDRYCTRCLKEQFEAAGLKPVTWVRG